MRRAPKGLLTGGAKVELSSDNLTKKAIKLLELTGEKRNGSEKSQSNNVSVLFHCQIFRKPSRGVEICSCFAGHV